MMRLLSIIAACLVFASAAKAELRGLTGTVREQPQGKSRIEPQVHQHDHRSGNVAVASFPAPDRAAVRDANRTSKRPGREAEAMPRLFEFGGGHLGRFDAVLARAVVDGHQLIRLAVHRLGCREPKAALEE